MTKPSRTRPGATWRSLQPRAPTLQPRALTLQPHVLRYDVARPATELRLHAGFGLGAHRSPGWRLGLVGACEAVQAVLRACPRLRLAPGYTPEWKPLDSLHCLTALHVCG